MLGLGCLALVVLSTREVTRREVVGEYRINRGGSRYELQVRGDGHWVQRVRTPAGVQVDSGTWEWERVDDRPTVSFDDFPHRWRPEFADESVAVGIWPAEPERSWLGNVRFVLDYDLALYYERR